LPELVLAEMKIIQNPYSKHKIHILINDAHNSNNYGTALNKPN
jgi:hypothetical protein